jgi:hypothetical protein
MAAGWWHRWLNAGLAAALAGLGGCSAPEPLPTTLSPPIALVAQNPWAAASEVAAKVPRSSIVVGHGRSMEPLYPEGTVLVLQYLRWENLRAGMTTIYQADPDNPYQVVAHVLLQRDQDRWEAQGLANRASDRVWLTADNYLGTAVAAFRQAPPSAPNLIRAMPDDQAGTCLLRCHVDAAPAHKRSR